MTAEYFFGRRTDAFDEAHEESLTLGDREFRRG